MKCAFHFENHKTSDFQSNLLVSWELVTEGHQRRPIKTYKFQVKYVHFKQECAHFNEMCDRKDPSFVNSLVSVVV